jgi:membrane protein implicated in regulation of membrane protease activity
MESLYPVFAVLVAIVALGLGAAELIFLEMKPAAFLTWLGGWAAAMSLTFSAPFGLAISGVVGVGITALYVVGISKLLGHSNERS